ncbi:uncharacterized protein IWZ02DRAFT_488531 [Phyllosticta citriasiana]|uniref:uncharacterized protein n=1 Tax=Phyllosticta citriasiana TaxID=595635 RepID=UPI0030FD392C
MSANNQSNGRPNGEPDSRVHLGERKLLKILDELVELKELDVEVHEKHNIPWASATINFRRISVRLPGRLQLAMWYCCSHLDLGPNSYQKQMKQLWERLLVKAKLIVRVFGTPGVDMIHAALMLPEALMSKNAETRSSEEHLKSLWTRMAARVENASTIEVKHWTNMIAGDVQVDEEEEIDKVAGLIVAQIKETFCPLVHAKANAMPHLSLRTIIRSFRGLDKIFESKPLPQHPYFRPSMDSHADLPNGGLNPVGKSLFEVEIPYLEWLNSANLHTDLVNHDVHDATGKSLSEAFASRGVIHALFAEDMLPALTVGTIEEKFLEEV